MSKPVVDAPRGRLLRGTEAATRLGIGYDALLRLIEAKRIAHLTHPSGRLHGIYEADCERYVEEHRVRDEPASPPEPAPSALDPDAAVYASLEPHERLW